MKKIVIPAILTATILVAGMFAFMPVQKASTVHTTITANVETETEFTQATFQRALAATTTATADAVVGAAVPVTQASIAFAVVTIDVTTAAADADTVEVVIRNAADDALRATTGGVLVNSAGAKVFTLITSNAADLEVFVDNTDVGVGADATYDLDVSIAVVGIE